jgi:hypothetical protein
MIKNFDKYNESSQYVESEKTDIIKIITDEMETTIEEVSPVALLKKLNRKYLGKKIRVYLKRSTYDMDVREIRTSLCLKNRDLNGMCMITIEFYDTETHFTVVGGDEEIAVLQKRIISDVDPYGEENWEN